MSSSSPGLEGDAELADLDVTGSIGADEPLLPLSRSESSVLEGRLLINSTSAAGLGAGVREILNGGRSRWWKARCIPPAVVAQLLADQSHTTYPMDVWSPFRWLIKVSAVLIEVRDALVAPAEVWSTARRGEIMSLRSSR